MPEEIIEQKIEETIEFEEETWLNEKNVDRFQLAYRAFLVFLAFLVAINVFIPVYLRRNPDYTVIKSGCIGIDINETCVGIAKYARELRKTAEFE